MVRRAAALPAASSVGVARSPRVGVPSIPRVVSGGWWVCAGVIRMASDACFRGACRGVRPWESWGVRWGWGGAGPPVVVCSSWVWVVAWAVVPFSSAPCSPLLPLPGSWVVSCPHVVSLPAPCPYGCLPSLGAPRALLPECSLVSLALPLPLSFPFLGVVVAGGAGWGGGADGPGPRLGRLEPLAEGLGVVGGRRPWTASRRRTSHTACGMMASGAASFGSAGVRVRISSKVCTMCTPSCLPAPPAHFTQRRSSCKAGADHQARWAGALGGEASVPGVLERRAEDVDLWWCRGWWCLGERELQWRGLGVEDGYGWRGERKGEVDMGRRWRAWWRPEEREWWWRGLGVVDGYGQQGERGAWRGLWEEGEVDVGRRWRAWRRRGERERCWRGLGVGVLYGRRGEGGVDMGRWWRSWWRRGEQERQERGPGGSLWHLGERERREWVVEVRLRCGECERRGRVCRAGGERERRCLRDRASSLESGPSGGVGGSQGASRGAAWYWGGGVPRRPWIRPVGVWSRQRLVVWVE